MQSRSSGSFMVTGSAALLTVMSAAPVLAQIAPVQTAPVQTASTQTASTQTTPAQATPAQTGVADKPLEELIVTAPNYVPQGSLSANKSDIPLVETPQAVTVISRDQIDLLDWGTLSQTVRYTAGVTGENYGPDERVDWLTMRGFNPVQYIDGLQAAVGSITNTGLDLYGAESVDILKGPSSVLYGQTPPGGIVNITSRRPRDEFDGELALANGNYDHRQVNADFTGAINDWMSARLTGLYRDRGTQTRGVDSQRTYVAPAVTFKPGSDTRLTLLSYYQRDELTGDGGGFLPAYGVLLPNPLGKVSSTTNLGETSYNRFYRRHYAVGYDLSHKFSDTLSIRQNLKYSHLDNDQRGVGGGGLIDFVGAIGPGGIAMGDGIPDDYRTVSRYSFSFAEDIDVFAVDTRINASTTTGAIEHQLLAGVDYRTYDYIGSSAFGFGMPTIDLFAPVYGLSIPSLPPVKFADQLQKQTGVYLQDQMKLDNIILTLAGRNDWVDDEQRAANTSTSDDEFSYRAGLSYLFDSGVAPYIAYSKSFQPTAGADRSGNPFVPTTGKQIEAGLKFDARNAPDGVKLFATLALYQLKQQNVLTTDPANIGFESFSVQTGEVEVKGIETEAVARFNERLSVNASYTYTGSEVTRSEGPDLGNRLPVVPEHKLSALIDYTLQDGRLAGLGASFGGRYMSQTTGNLASVFQPQVFTNPAVTLFDGSIHFDSKDWRFAFTASNLFDKEYVARCYSVANCFYGTRRIVNGSVTRKF